MRTGQRTYEKLEESVNNDEQPMFGHFRSRYPRYEGANVRQKCSVISEVRLLNGVKQYIDITYWVIYPADSLSKPFAGVVSSLSIRALSRIVHAQKPPVLALPSRVVLSYIGYQICRKVISPLRIASKPRSKYYSVHMSRIPFESFQTSIPFLSPASSHF